MTSEYSRGVIKPHIRGLPDAYVVMYEGEVSLPLELDEIRRYWVKLLCLLENAAFRRHTQLNRAKMYGY